MWLKLDKIFFSHPAEKGEGKARWGEGAAAEQMWGQSIASMGKRVGFPLTESSSWCLVLVFFFGFLRLDFQAYVGAASSKSSGDCEGLSASSDSLSPHARGYPRCQCLKAEEKGSHEVLCLLQERILESVKEATGEQFGKDSSSLANVRLLWEDWASVPG